MLQYVDTMIGFSAVMLLLSLLVTVIVQGGIAILNLRGQVLHWGVQRLLEQIAPALERRKGQGDASAAPITAEVLARRVLTHPLVSQRGELSVRYRRYATAIRLDELVMILKDLTSRESHIKEAIGKVAADWTALYKDIPLAEIEALLPKEDAEKVEVIVAKLKARAADEEARIAAWYDDLKARYGAVMDRTTERFVAWTKLITVGVALVLSSFLNIDSIAIFKQISGNPDLRARLVQSADATIKLADDYSTKQDQGAKLASDALDAARKDALDAAKKEGRDLAIDPVDPNLRTHAQGIQWLDGHVKDADLNKALHGSFETNYTKNADAWAKTILDEGKAIRNKVDETQLVITSGWSWPKPDHALGIIATWLFLSLGGPFWYNVLRQLANLRPLLAGKVEKDEGSSDA